MTETKKKPAKRKPAKRKPVKRKPAEPAAAKKRGRPKNAKTQDRPEVTVVHTPCRHCGATAGATNKRLIREGDYSGEYQGKTYTRYRHSHANCKVCGKAILLREFE